MTSLPALRLLAVAGVAGWLLGLGVHLAAARGLVDRNGEPVGGDFIAPYTAGRLVLAGAGRRLYDLELQQRLQGRIIGRPDFRGLCSFVNPPIVAAALTPLAWLPFRTAYVIYTALMFLVYLLGLRALRPHLPVLRGAWGTVAGVGLLFYPITITITGGQNAALTLALLAGAYATLRSGRDVRAGVLLGLLLYKPQFALLPMLLVAVERRYRTLAAAGVVAGMMYVVGAAVCGADWPLVMARSLRAYWPLENHFNGDTSISLIGAAEAAWPQAAGKLIGILLAVGVVVLCLASWRRRGGEGDALGLRWALAVSGGLLVSPHTQWYDSGLLLLVAILVLDARLARDGDVPLAWRVGLAGAFCVPAAYGATATVGVQPVFALALAGFFWAWRETRRAGGPEAAKLAPGVSTPLAPS